MDSGIMFGEYTSLEANGKNLFEMLAGYLDTPIQRIFWGDCNRRIQNSLRCRDITNLKGLLSITETEFLYFHNIGCKSYRDVWEVIWGMAHKAALGKPPKGCFYDKCPPPPSLKGVRRECPSKLPRQSVCHGEPMVLGCLSSCRARRAKRRWWRTFLWK